MTRGTLSDSKATKKLRTSKSGISKPYRRKKAHKLTDEERKGTQELLGMLDKKVNTVALESESVRDTLLVPIP